MHVVQPYDYFYYYFKDDGLIDQGIKVSTKQEIEGSIPEYSIILNVD